MEACNLCGGTRWKSLEHVGETRVVHCDCGLVFVTPQPPRRAIEGAYSKEYYKEWEAQAQRRARIWRQRVQRVESFASPPGRLLDVGCGVGDFLQAARARGWNVTGTEFSPYAVTAAAADGLTVHPGELWEVGFPADTFDVVTCWHAIEHVADPRRLVEEIHRILRPGGWFVLATPNLHDYIFRAAYLVARRRWPRIYEPGEREIHLCCFSERTLRRLVASARFDVVEAGFDRGAAAVWGKVIVNEIAYAWFRISGYNWGMALELVARKPPKGLG